MYRLARTLASILPRTKLETGRLVSPDGVPFVGFKLTFTDLGGPAMTELNYEDIERMVGANPDEVVLVEDRDENGRLKSIRGSS